MINVQDFHLPLHFINNARDARNDDVSIPHLIRPPPKDFFGLQIHQQTKAGVKEFILNAKEKSNLFPTLKKICSETKGKRGLVGRRFDREGAGDGVWSRGSNYFQASNDMLARLIRQ